METDHRNSLEQALAKTEAEADAACRAATASLRTLKKFRAAAQMGDLRELQKTVEAAGQVLADLEQQFAKAKAGWDFDEEPYLSNGLFVAEVLATAAQTGVHIYERDDRLYCYPSLIRVLPNDRAVVIDKTRERRLRPSVLVRHLQELQNKPVRFKSEAFLESLHDAYSTAVKTRGKERRDTAAIVPLVEIYNLLTLLPGQAKEYSRQEFARDLYLLDQSGVTAVRSGAIVSFHAARGNEAASKVIPLVTKDGHAKTYYGISFTSERG
ncbi:MAG TPA: hypothetical protein VGX03_12090 [Candidatus Binatia bacterium]|nr:hypothetical protein [Candidatus Binatia bacterium]